MSGSQRERRKPQAPESTATVRPPPLTEEERRSLTRTELELSEVEERTFGDALAALNDAGIPGAMSGLFSVYLYTGVSRHTEDLDLLVEPRHIVPAAEALERAGFRTVLQERHWLAKAERDGQVVDLVFGMANGLCLIDGDWHRRGVDTELWGEAFRVASPEDLIFHRLFITERHRFDMSDIVHLILVMGPALDWDRLLDRVGDHWRLLFAQILFFDFSYPRRRQLVPDRIRRELKRKLDETAPEASTGREPCRGTLISRFSFAVDVHEWGFRDRRAESVDEVRSRPVIQEIAASDVWDVRRNDGAATPTVEAHDGKEGGGDPDR